MSDLFNPDETMSAEYTGNGNQLFPLALKTALLTLVTLGIYRFWARTRIRKFFWSAVAPGGQPFEYDGKGLEKLLGFLIAVAVLAVYLGILQVLLTFAGMSLFGMADSSSGNELQAVAVTYITLLALLPLIFYAAYRAQRYKLSRTRWRGIRFAMDKAAWGYSWRGIMYTFLNIISLGILMPLSTFRLEKYKIDRTYYGQAQMFQGGKWTGLYPAMKHLGIALLLFVFGGLSFTGMDFSSLEDGELSGSGAGFGFLGGVLLFFGYIWFLIGMAYYRVHSFRYLTAHKVLGENVRAQSLPLTSNVVGYYLLGAVVGGMAAMVAGLIVGGVLALLGYFIVGEAGALFGGVAGYIAAFLAYGVAYLVMTVHPTIKHFAQTTTLYNTAELDTIAQREGDHFAEAEGFADALDLGAGF